MGVFDRIQRLTSSAGAAVPGEGVTKSEEHSQEDAADIEAAAEPATAEPSEAEPSEAEPRKAGWSGSRLVALLAGVAVVSLLIGVGAMQFIVSPAELAARTAPPDAGPVTAPVEKRAIENTVLTRGEVTYADAVKLTIDAGSAENRPVVTGHVPEVGAVLNAGSVALELAGRPVVVLPGDLPAYRDLSIGMRGPDVSQLKHALAAMGYGSGDLASDAYDWNTANAVGAMYEQLGYPAPSRAENSATDIRSAERSLRSARVELSRTQTALDLAAEAGTPNLTAEVAARDAAAEEVAEAQQSLAQAQEDALPKLPSSEVAFLSGLPRRVDEVTVKRGALLEGSPMVVSGATLAIVGTISAQDAALLPEGATASYSGPDGSERTATLTLIEESTPATGGDGSGENPGGSAKSGDAASKRMSVRFDPGELTPEDIAALRGSNVRLRIPVASTGGEVLAVPIAALSADAAGGDRVELVTGEPDGKNTRTETVTVTAGLAADGFVEVSSSDKRIAPGARVVVGR